MEAPYPPAVQTMRNLDVHRHDPERETTLLPQRQAGIQDGSLSPVTVKDFQDQHRLPTRRPSTPNFDRASPRVRTDSAPPIPDPRLRYKHHPPRNESLNNNHRSPYVQDQNVSRSPSPASAMSSDETYETQATSIQIPPLQAESALESFDQMEPLQGDLPGSFDLVEPADDHVNHHGFSLEARSEQLFSHEHLKVIFADPTLLLRFTAFLSTHRPRSVPILIYYLDALKALKAIKYANAIAEALSPIPGHEYTANLAPASSNAALENKANQAFDALVREDLPAYITQMYVQIVSLSISQRITGVLAPHLREASEGLAEVFCLTDPSRPDNPIVFASEEFCRTTQYGMGLSDAVKAGREQCEVFLNYRRDGSPFMNMLMIAPLCDSRGKIRYHIGAQVDVSGLAKDCTDLESLQKLVSQQQAQRQDGSATNGVAQQEKGDEFQELSEMLNMGELETVRRHGGRMHREYQDEETESQRNTALHKPRLLLEEPSIDPAHAYVPGKGRSGKLSGIYQNYLLIRPYPSLRILFASPTLRVPGILQSPFMNKIGGSSRVQDELTSALAEGRGVTAKVRWVSKADEEGRNRWIHCTPLIGSNGQIGVWMIVIIDDDQGLSRKWKQAPPVATHRGREYGTSRDAHSHHGRMSDDLGSSVPASMRGAGSMRGDNRKMQGRNPETTTSTRSASPNSVRIY
ncbi:MAG: hypothetical protein HETSPECPRED_000146 [Heterodermia speciosa]|uniref:PAC domain-containing protein n=1 Tax=Heterodermia speciosa TaxID=116794 RepID=A0A8H3HUR0_9LECA|nr:MAG: hypothetical protein HETSPECPRED_000146 [Heterodermia speciosa]